MPRVAALVAPSWVAGLHLEHPEMQTARATKEHTRTQHSRLLHHLWSG